jgi:ribosomal protein S18 acetylase RimI-like enzyme
MSKTGSGKSSRGGSSKAGSNESSVVVSKTLGMQTPQECRIILRKALFNDDGTDKDVTKTLSPFMKMKAQDAEIEFDFVSAKKLWKKNPTLAEYCYGLVQEQMEDQYDDSGYGWDDNDKQDEMRDKSTRYLLVMHNSPDGRKICGFAHFGFTLQGDILDQAVGQPVLKIYNLNLQQDMQRKGIGRRLMQICEMAAQNASMSHVQAMVTSENECAHKFFNKKLNGYKADDVSEYCEVELEDEEELATFTLYNKSLCKKAIKHVDPAEDTEDDDALVASLVKQIAAANVSAENAGAQAEAILAEDEDEVAEELV